MSRIWATFGRPDDVWLPLSHGHLSVSSQAGSARDLPGMELIGERQSRSLSEVLSVRTWRPLTV